MDPAYLPPFVPLLPSAAPALVGPFLFAVTVLVTGLAAVVTMLLRSISGRGGRDTIVIDLIARPRARSWPEMTASSERSDA